jgi:hypothetical protein
MMNLIDRTILFMNLVVILTSCIGRSVSVKDSSFAGMFPIDDINESLELSFVEVYSSELVENEVTLNLENLSPTIVIFPPNYGARGFMYNSVNEVWIEISNKIMFYPETGIGLDSRDNELQNSGFVLFSPDFGNSDPPSSIRIIVIGNPVINDEISEIEYGAFIDVDLNP